MAGELPGDIRTRIKTVPGQKEVDTPLQSGARQYSELTATLEVLGEEGQVDDLIVACRIGLSKIGQLGVAQDQTTIHILKENPQRPINRGLLETLKKTMDSEAIDQGIKDTHEKAAILLILQEDDPILVKTLTEQL